MSASGSRREPRGTEWQGAGTLDKVMVEHDTLQSCARMSVACLAAWARTTGIQFDAVYIVGPDGESSRQPVPTLLELIGLQQVPRSDCCAPLRASVITSNAWTVVYDSPGGLIAVPKRP